MTRKPLVNIAQSVHQRLLTRAQKEERPFNELLQHYDIWTLARNLEFDGQRLSEAIRKTFERRKTDPPNSVPTAFTPEFYEDKAKQTQWKAFLNKGLATKEPISLAEVMEVIRNFLTPPTDVLISGKAFKMRWPQGGPWRPV